jgi:hypothetical protein
MRKPPISSREAWTPEQTATCLRVSVQTLYYWRRTDTGPPSHRVGRHLRYVPDEVMAWLREQA